MSRLSHVPKILAAAFLLAAGLLLLRINVLAAGTASLLVWIIGLAAVIPLWGRQASNFFLAWRKR